MFDFIMVYHYWSLWFCISSSSSSLSCDFNFLGFVPVSLVFSLGLVLSSCLCSYSPVSRVSRRSLLLLSLCSVSPLFSVKSVPVVCFLFYFDILSQPCYHLFHILFLSCLCIYVLCFFLLVVVLYPHYAVSFVCLPS